MNRACTDIDSVGSGYFHQVEAFTAFVTGALDCRARHAYPQKQAEDIFIFILREPFQTPGFLEVPI